MKKIILPIAFFIITICCFYFLSENYDFNKVIIQEEDKTEPKMTIIKDEEVLPSDSSADLPQELFDDLSKGEAGAGISVDEIKKAEEKIREEALVREKALAEQEGLEIEILQDGQGASAKNGDEVSVHYTGILEDGTKFDSSVDKGQPFSFPLGEGRVIKGWDLGVLGMKIGEKRKLTIQPELGYGEGGMGSSIPPNAVLIFEVELLEIK